MTHVHPLSPADAAVRAQLRAALAPHKGQVRGLAARAAFDAVLRRTPPAPSVEYAPGTLGSVPGIWCRPAGASNRTILWLHGGWFVSGSADAYRTFIGHFAAGAGAAAFVVDYRLAPEHPYPAATHDVRTAYQALVDGGARDIVVAGDSAGGALALELVDWVVHNASETQPQGLVLISPITDLSLSGESWTSRDAADVLFSREQAREFLAAYLADTDAATPFAPLTADLAGFPPMRIDVGDDEVLLDDSIRLARRASAAGIDVQPNVWEGMLHGFPSAVGTFEAANLAVDEIAAFIRDVQRPAG